MAPCGYLFVHQPWINKHHSTPFHFWHATGTAMVLLLKTVGLEVVDYRDWGNWEYVSKVLKEHRWPRLRYMENLNSEDRQYSQTMLLGRKLPCGSA